MSTNSSFVYNTIKRCLPVDVSYLLWLSTHDFLPSKPVEGAECRVLESKDIFLLSQIKDFELSPQTASDFDELDGVAVGVFIHEKLVGISLFIAGEILANHQQKRKPFLGIATELPPGTRYLYKSFVLPEYRGQRLHSAMVRFVINHFDTDRVHTLVTLADISERAFLSSLMNQGFESVGLAAEVVLFGKHFYRLPKPVDSLSGKSATEGEGCIVLHVDNGGSMQFWRAT